MIAKIIENIKKWFSDIESIKIFINFIGTLYVLSKLIRLMVQRLPQDRKLKEIVQLKTAMQDAHRTKSTFAIKNYMLRKFK